MRHPTDAVFNVAGGTKRVPMTTCQPINRCTLSKVTSSARDSPRTTRPVHAVSTAFPAGPPVHGRTGSSPVVLPDRFGDDVLTGLGMLRLLVPVTRTGCRVCISVRSQTTCALR
jgi:hypothetical protein